MEVEAVNVGRRPVVLRLVGGYYENGDWNGQNVGEGKTGVRLEENERYSENIDDLRYLVRDHETGVQGQRLRASERSNGLVRDAPKRFRFLNAE